MIAGKTPDQMRQYGREYYQRTKVRRAELNKVNAPQRKAYLEKWVAENYERYLLRSAKSRAKSANIPFDLQVSDIVIPAFCPLLKTPLTRTRKRGRVWSNPSIDRIDSAQGYVRGNVWVISVKANTMKNDASSAELLTFARSIQEHFHDE